MFKKLRNKIANSQTLLVGVFSLFAICISANEATRLTAAPQERAQANSDEEPKVQKVILEYSRTLSFDKLINADAQVLRGDVRFRQEGMLMFCDSAYFYESNNSLEAFGNVRMEQGDTLFVYSDYLRYDGTKRLAELRYNVKMENRDVVLLTDSLNYDRMVNVGYYFEGGVLTDPENELTSIWGQYQPDTKDARFNRDVKLVNERYVLYSDTLHYNTNTRIADIQGPSTIVSDTSTIYTSKGWYDTNLDLARLYERSVVVSGTQMLTGDTLFYDRNIGYGEGFSNVEVADTTRKMTLYGQYGYYNEKSEEAFVTDSAWMMEFSRVDTTYMSADTLKTVPDSIWRVMHAIHDVRMFSNQAQAVGGLFTFTSRDSVLKMQKDPILWNGNYQVYGDTILSYMNDSTIDWAHVQNFAFVASLVDSAYVDFYNQLVGKDMKAYFVDGEMRKLDVSGNVRTIFYPQESDSTIVGQNSAESSYLRLELKEGQQIDKLVMWPQPKGALTPVVMLTSDKLYLPDYRWYDYLRPKDKEDIFRKASRKSEDAPAKHVRRQKK
ncbi:MAG: OstA-like protein [Bacteroidales bacterium]